MKPATHAKRKARRAEALLLCLLSLSLLSCRQEQEGSSVADINIRAAHLHDYAWQDRNQSGQPVEMKPVSERQALQLALQESDSDLLILRGLGSEASLNHLQSALAESDNSYPHLYYVPGDNPYHGIGFLSRIPFSEVRNLSSNSFRIKEKQFQPLAGGVKISTPAFPVLWIWNQQAPSPEESYERRRSEARILAQSLRPLIAQGDEVLLSLHSREAMDSPMLRLLEESGLQRLVPTDSRGDSWTHRDPDGILYQQDQWLFASPGLQEKISSASVLDSENLRQAGPYRHQEIVLP